MGPWPPFFHLTSSFFGLTSAYKTSLLDEIYITTQHLKGVTYSDVLSMPTYERRYFLSMLTKDMREREDKMEEMRQQQTSSSKGNRTTRVSGAALKTKLQSGEIPTN